MKISITCVRKEHEGNTKNGTGAMATAKNEVCIGL